ncbi:MAG TPA: B12-binding domain-containing radical SAM protein [Desulfitobacteriaceae bacterium]|nr:B12-binding domain-containing radical SAM protein [Desulfitobacteriaceae bacterium]
MRVLLVALNAKYVQTNLALRYLRETVINEFPATMLKEATINEPIARLTGELYEAKADVIGFSCYLWNITETLKIIRDLRLVLPKIRIVLGGPEVSFETEKLMYDNPEVDAVVQGEGEAVFLELLRSWKSRQDPDNVPGLVWRCQDRVVSNPRRSLLVDLDQLPDPYASEEKLDNRLVYVETTRGCPFSCQYCLSSAETGVRYAKPENFRRVFSKLLTYGARTIKFVDRTFNTCKEHAWKILDIIREEVEKAANARNIRIHCEIAGELLDEDWLAYLKKYPQGLLQLEIGVQSTYRPALENIARSQHFEIWRKYILELRQNTEIPLHLDLIAGLPGENWDNFRLSFNDVYETQPQKLQLGFLKVLKGSGLRQKASRYGLVYQPDPPYSVLQTAELSYPDLLQLKRMEILLDKYYNSGRFQSFLPKVISLFPTAFDFYDFFAQFWHHRNWLGSPWKEKALFERLWLFVESWQITNSGKISGQELELLRDVLRFDYYCWERPGLVPDFLLSAATVAAGSAATGGRNEKATQQHSMGELKKLLCEKFAQDFGPRTVSLIDLMDRQQWARATAIAYFSAPRLNCYTGIEELKPDQVREDKAICPQNKQVGYLFFYNENKVWCCPLNYS